MVVCDYSTILNESNNTVWLSYGEVETSWKPAQSGCILTWFHSCINVNNVMKLQKAFHAWLVLIIRELASFLEWFCKQWLSGCSALHGTGHTHWTVGPRGIVLWVVHVSRCMHSTVNDLHASIDSLLYITMNLTFLCKPYYMYQVVYRWKER